jgi:hypothetical protein
VVSKPNQLDPLAQRILTQLAGKPEAGEIVLGGYFALQHYLDYRRTHDIDGWWRTRANPATEQLIRDAMSRVARDEGSELRERRFGETVSFELVREGRRYFSFQIAVRSVTLEPPRPSAWPPVLIETINDNIGSKMNALVDRGSPRDFMDIKQVVDARLATIEQCWSLWLAKNAGARIEEGKQKVLFHLAALDARRPLDTIEGPDQRRSARATREWYRIHFAAP